jgi:ATP-dependent protease Clp ATPase subunit
MSGGLSNAAEDNAEMDAFLKQVEARDLIEFGMIPVSCASIYYSENNYNGSTQLRR